MSQLQALLGGAAPAPAPEPAGLDLSALLGGMGGAAPAAEPEQEDAGEDTEKAMIAKLLGGM